MQLDLFENRPVTEIEMQVQLVSLKHSQEKLRRGMFQRYDDLRKTVVDLQMQLDELLKTKAS